MSLTTLLGITEGALGAVVVVAWALVIGVILYRYQRGDISRSKASIWSAAALFWLAWGILQVGGAIDERAGQVIDVLGATAGVAAIGVLLWWCFGRLRRKPTVE